MRLLPQFFPIALGLVVALASSAVWAQTVSSNAVTSQLSAQVVGLVDGKVVTKPAADAKPGDVIEYRSVYGNNTKSTINGLLATIPVPAGTTYVEGSAVPAAPTASVDTVTFATIPLIRTVQGANGVIRKEPVPLAEYRAVRWNAGSLGAGQETVVSLRVRVNPTLGAAPAAASSPLAKP